MDRTLELILVIVILALAGTLPSDSSGRHAPSSPPAAAQSLLPSLGVPLR